MPTYQYACTECGHAFEQHQSFSDDALTVCPQCQGRLRKVFNAVGVVFKGSGFYRTDSRTGATSGSSVAAGASSDSGTSTSNGSSNGTGASTGTGTAGSTGSTSGAGASTSGSTSTPSTSGGSSAA